MKKTIILLVAFTCFSFAHAQVTTGTKLQFTYDVSGNQQLRDVATTSATTATEAIDSTQVLTTNELTFDNKEVIANKFRVSPNPTTGEVILQWEPEFSDQITAIELVSLVTSKKTKIERAGNNSVQVNLFDQPSGLYLVIFYLNTPEVSSIQKKIIKL
ncbi:hypothetical protein [Aquimarina sediminis]|uniref:hypothetical protein n=1 Tax=Aquimarina sediminis TaxID=2070536 RepID=UPI000CA06A40|nr:hypothetical protein [Aquimarina sediminis]